ncbi:MAG: type II secretion system minor pseudopilin GspH [Gammaproteobacteria bacterium]|nr:type II secretion system minor pseudopilin GspH [Gammaproteobacteria bacterium]
MPISSTRICNRPRGFTLLEILIVITIVGVLTGTVILGFTGADAEQDLKGAAQRMALRVELARQRALQRNREWGIYIRADAYVFAEYDPREQAWIELEERPFKQSDIPALVELRLQTEGVGELPFADGGNTPQIIVFSSGEITPFTIYLLPDWNSVAWLVTSDGISRTSAQREGGRV